MNVFFRDENASGPVNDGMSRSEVRRILGGFQEFLKSKSSGVVDDFSDTVAHVYYDERDLIKGVEVFRGGKVALCGVNPFDSTAEVFFKIIRNKGMEVIEFAPAVFVISELRARLYVPDILEDGNAEIDSVYLEF
ncbi:hypothetical protein [Stenotrophomonas pigmentata]|uniref:hypothetical protein n=1 Tax=Stenotrophomonas pigmentata TaxID=3055080 RepID=UPI0026E9D243|nr:hypothetical protein [Stenotrophomonas sp. 610A2]